jgi:hypothetical protein
VGRWPARITIAATVRIQLTGGACADERDDHDAARFGPR